MMTCDGRPLLGDSISTIPSTTKNRTLQESIYKDAVLREKLKEERRKKKKKKKKTTTT
eukprot:CAMPEP_0174233156 /NCGR_PEP_ID=MMETSP0417-20130205/3268_1 /TAXON_ID=242541 /ORGANISM="Mayorella sp, Strain BSH-02190019" /LENGTH=57 /DNA_ID=CAMNT_0015311323 /DNA_START=72 /DNA_END=242 /DNA_ORIENTATION=+